MPISPMPSRPPCKTIATPATGCCSPSRRRQKRHSIPWNRRYGCCLQTFSRRQSRSCHSCFYRSFRLGSSPGRSRSPCSSGSVLDAPESRSATRSAPSLKPCRSALPPHWLASQSACWSIVCSLRAGSERSRIALLDFDVRRPDHLAPLLGFGDDESSEIGGRARKRRRTQIGEPRFYLGFAKRKVYFLVQLIDDFGRCVL